MNEDAREILVKLEPALAAIRAEQARQGDRLARIDEALVRADERARAKPTPTAIVGLVVGVVAVGALMAVVIL